MNKSHQMVYADSVPVFNDHRNSSPINERHQVVYTDSVPVIFNNQQNGSPIKEIHQKVYKDSVPVIFYNQQNDLPSSINHQYDDLKYKMNHPMKGFALIINNEVHSCGGDEETSRKEVRSMSDTLKDLKFKVIVRNNLKVCDTKQIFTDLSKLDHSICDCFICVILTRGSRSDIIQCSDDSVFLTELMALFLSDKCPTLIGKPKLFFIQNAALLQGSISNLELYSASKVPMISLSEDFLVVSCIVNSERKDGGFIEILSDNLKDCGTEMELQYILIRVNNYIAAVSKRIGLKTLNHTPLILSTLTKQLMLSWKT